MLKNTAPRQRFTSKTQPTDCVSDFLDRRGDALALALERLGGRPAFARFCRLREGLRAGRASPRVIRVELQNMLDLLTLKFAGDPDRVESSLFMAINPASPKVHEMCRLAEEVAHLLAHVHGLAATEVFKEAASAPALGVQPSPRNLAPQGARHAA